MLGRKVGLGTALAAAVLGAAAHLPGVREATAGARRRVQSARLDMVNHRTDSLKRSDIAIHNAAVDAKNAEKAKRRAAQKAARKAAKKERK